MTTPVHPIASARGEARPVRRRTRTFRPNYLSFAGTYQCNLTCPHCCVPIEWPDRLDIAVALRFLEDAHAAGIEIARLHRRRAVPVPRVPARPDAAGRPSWASASTRCMTNGVWYRDAGAPGSAC